MSCHFSEPTHIFSHKRNGLSFLASVGFVGESLVDESEIVADHMAGVDVDIE